MTQSNTESNVPNPAPIMQNQIDTLGCTVQALTEQRSGALDALTASQTSYKMKERQVQKQQLVINEMQIVSDKYSAQSNLWSARYAEMVERNAALTWYCEQLLTEIPDMPIQELDADFITTIVQNYIAHKSGEKLKVNAAKVAQAQIKAKVLPVADNVEGEEIVTTSGGIEVEVEEIQLETSLSPKETTKKSNHKQRN